jgi:hypothetical protein
MISDNYSPPLVDPHHSTPASLACTKKIASADGGIEGEY